MSVVIKLQHLPVTATSHDIRQFFRSLAIDIPDGGVHIVGGSDGDVFIIFSTDEDARQAMILNGSCIKDSPVRLSLSSGYEMSQVIEQTYQKALRTMKSLNHSSSYYSNNPNPAPVSTTTAAEPSASLESTSSSVTNDLLVTPSPNNPHAILTPPPFSSGSLIQGINSNTAMVGHNFPGNLTQSQVGHRQVPPSLLSQAPPPRNLYGHGPRFFNSTDNVGFLGPVSNAQNSLMNHKPPVLNNGPWIHPLGSNHIGPHAFVPHTHSSHNNNNFSGRLSNHAPPNAHGRRNMNYNNGPYRYRPGIANRNRRRPPPWINMNNNIPSSGFISSTRNDHNSNNNS